MKIMESWIINYALLVRLDDGSYRIGTTSNVYGFMKVDNYDASLMIKKNEILPKYI